MNERVRVLNSEPRRPQAQYVLYWCRANRRVRFNHALEYAAGLANELGLPLLWYESLAYPEPNDRLTSFLLQGVPDVARQLAERGIGHAFHAEDALHELASSAAAVVTDDYPVWADTPTLDVALYAVDSSCIVPMSLFEKRQYAAYAIRPHIKRALPRYLKPVEPVRLRHLWAELCSAAELPPGLPGSSPPSPRSPAAKSKLTASYRSFSKTASAATPASATNRPPRPPPA